MPDGNIVSKKLLIRKYKINTYQYHLFINDYMFPFIDLDWQCLSVGRVGKTFSAAIARCCSDRLQISRYALSETKRIENKYSTMVPIW